MQTIDFRIVTPNGTVYEDHIEKVTNPTTAGEITVYPKHMGLVSIVKPGEITVHKGGDTIGVAVSGGILEVRPESEVYIMADTAERGEDIDMERAETARKRAEELLSQQKNIADVDYARIQAQMEREMARLSIGKKYKDVR